MKKKPLTLAKVKKKLWTLVSRYVRLSNADKSGYCRCYTCGAVKHWKEIQGGHCFGKKAHPGTYFDLDNIRPQCSKCNCVLDGMGAEFILRLEEEIGRERVDALRLKAKTGFGYKRADLLLMIEEYKEKLSQYEKLYS